MAEARANIFEIARENLEKLEGVEAPRVWPLCYRCAEGKHDPGSCKFVSRLCYFCRAYGHKRSLCPKRKFGFGFQVPQSMVKRLRMGAKKVNTGPKTDVKPGTSVEHGRKPYTPVTEPVSP